MASLVLQRLQEPGRAVAIATAMGTSESTVSRLKNDHLESFARLLAHAGLKIVDCDAVCVKRERWQAMSTMAVAAMSDETIARKLVWEDEQ